MAVETLNEANLALLEQAHAILGVLTDHHHHTCHCELCMARTMTIPDEEFRTIEYVSMEEG